MDLLEQAKPIINLLTRNGAKEALIVGGFVRDKCLGRESKDVDIEVYGISYARLLEILQTQYPNIDIVGKNFGTCKIGDVEVSIPRKESRVGPGHKDFKVDLLPNITIGEAAERRDFTVNSMALRIDGLFIDPHGGLKDLKAGLLKKTSDAFNEDALRVMRGFQFISRFGFTPEQETLIECQRMLKDARHLPSERLGEEWRKWAIGTYHAKALLFLKQTRWTVLWPNIHAMIGMPQDPKWHPEGDVYNHTCCVVSHMSLLTSAAGFDHERKQILMYAALLHDMGKVTTTINEANGHITSHQHDKVGATLAREFLHEIHAPSKVIKHVCPLVEEHMAHLSFNPKQNPSNKAVRRLAVRLDPASINNWMLLLEADANGRPPIKGGSPGHRFWEVAKQLGVNEKKPAPIVTGKNLLDAGWKTGVQLGKIHKQLFQAQLNGKFHDHPSGLEYLRTNYKPPTTVTTE